MKKIFFVGVQQLSWKQGRIILPHKTPLHKQSTLPFSTAHTFATAQVIKYEKFGQPSEVLKRVEEPLPPLKDNDVLVQILASPINPADLNMIQGNYGIVPSLPAVGGNEGVAKVLEVGSAVKNLSVNDQVIPTRPGLGMWRTHGVFKATDLTKIPNDIKPEYAATVSVNPCAALRMLEDFVQLKKDDVIIQNGASSMVASAVIQIARSRGIKTINIVRDRPNAQEMIDHLNNIGSFITVRDSYLQTSDIRRLISDLPKPKLALNCIGGFTATEMARVLANGGTMVTYGGMSIKPITLPTSVLIFKDITLRGFWLTKWVEEHSSEERMAMINTLFTMMREDKLRLWMRDWNFNKFEEALAQATQPYKGRKVVLKMV